MLAVLLGFLLALSPPDSTDDLDRCLAKAPIQSPSPVTWGAGGVEAMWTEDPPAPRDTLQAYLSQVRWARRCLLELDPARISSPYLGNVMRTFDREAALLAGLRRFSAAFATFEEARSFLENDPAIPSTRNGRTSWLPLLHQNQGYLHYLLGDLSSSIEHYLKAYEATPEEEVSHRVRHLINLSILKQRLQDYRSARRYLNRAERRLRAADSTQTKHTEQEVRLYHSKADLLLEETLNAEFNRKALRRARDLAKRGRSLADPDTELYALLSIVLSESLGYLGTFDQAYRLNEQVREYAQSHDAPSLQTFALLKLGVLHVQTHRWSEANRALSRSLEMAESFRDLDVQRRSLRALGRLHELQRQWTEAEHYYRRGVAVVEKYRASLTASQWSMTAFAQWRDVHRGLVRTLLAQGRNREALTVLDRSRARHLKDLRIQTRVANQLPTDQRARFDSLTRVLTDVRNRLGRDRLSDREQTMLTNREAALIAARQHVLQIDTTVTSRPSIDELSERLARQDRVLVSYFLDDPWPVYDRSPRSAAFVLTGDTLHTVSLPNLTQDSVRTQLEATSPLFTSRGSSNRANAMHFDLRPLYLLQESLYAPVAKYLPEGRPLTIVPNGPLFRIPFSMLVRSMPGGRYAHSEARFLLHERPITVELATSLASDTSRSPQRSSSAAQAELAAFGISEFGTIRTVPMVLRSILSSDPLDPSLTLPDLPGVRSELRSVQRRVEGARIFLDEAATEEALWKTSERTAALHLASHAFLHPSSPLHNAILLHPDSSGAETDGVLFLHELQARTRPLSLVVLGGCNTARGARRGGEGMQGMQYAFRAMGTEATLSSLWPVADAANVELTDAFYRYLTQGLRKDEALRRAKLDYIEAHPEQASPFFWATTVLYGSPGPLDLESTDGLPRWAWWGLAMGVLLGVLLWSWVRRPARRRT